AAEVHLRLAVGGELAQDDDLVGLDLVRDDLERPRVAALVEARDDRRDVDVAERLAVLARAASHLLGGERPGEDLAIHDPLPTCWCRRSPAMASSSRRRAGTAALADEGARWP